MKKDVILYIIFGLCTTAINLGSFFIMNSIFGWNENVANFIAIILAVLFAYITNKDLVFHSKAESKKEKLQEFFRFMLGRAFTMIIEFVGGLLLFKLPIPQIITKGFLTIIVIILNFFISKFFAFREKKNQNNDVKEESKIEISKILKIAIIIIGIIALFTIVLLNTIYDVTIRRFEEHTDIQSMTALKLLISIVVIIGVVILTDFISNLKINKYVKIAGMVLSLALYATFQIVWIQYSIVRPGADQAFVYGTAKVLYNAQETLQEHTLTYFSFYRQNMGIVLIFEKLMQLFQNDSCNLCRYFNVACNVLMVLGLYWICNLVNNKNKQNKPLFFVLILCYLPISLLSTWVYGDFISLALSVWSVALMIKYVQSKKIRYFVISAICMGLAIIARENSLIFVIAIAIYLLFTLKNEKNVKDKIIRIVALCLFAIIAILPNKILINNISNKYQLNDRKEKSMITYLYMAMSEGNMANGWYNDEANGINEELKKRTKDDYTIEEQTMEKLKERIKYLIKNPVYTIKFYRDKILSTWAEPTTGSEVYNIDRGSESSDNKFFEFVMEGTNFKIVKLSQKIITYMIYAGSLICVILRRKKISNEKMLLLLIFLGGFFFHILWETKSRYIIPYVVILIPLAVDGISKFTEIIKEKIKIVNQ